MLTALDKQFKVWCKLKNKSACKILQIGSAKLQLNLGDLDEEDDENNEIKRQIIGLMPANLTDMSLDPGEQIECMSENILITDE